MRSKVMLGFVRSRMSIATSYLQDSASSFRNGMRVNEPTISPLKELHFQINGAIYRYLAPTGAKSSLRCQAQRALTERRKLLLCSQRL